METREGKIVGGFIFDWLPQEGLWRCESGRRPVAVTPPENADGKWTVVTVGTNRESTYSGEDAENRAFGDACISARQ